MKLYGLDVILKTLKVFSLSMLFHACLWNLVLSKEKSLLYLKFFRILVKN